MMPIPPAWAMAMAVRASVIVSIAALTSGTLSCMVRVSAVLTSASLGIKSDAAGTKSTSSKVNPSAISKENMRALLSKLQIQESPSDLWERRAFSSSLQRWRPPYLFLTNPYLFDKKTPLPTRYCGSLAVHHERHIHRKRNAPWGPCAGKSHKRLALHPFFHAFVCRMVHPAGDLARIGND